MEVARFWMIQEAVISSLEAPWSSHYLSYIFGWLVQPMPSEGWESNIGRIANSSTQRYKASVCDCGDRDPTLLSAREPQPPEHLDCGPVVFMGVENGDLFIA